MDLPPLGGCSTAQVSGWGAASAWHHNRSCPGSCGFTCREGVQLSQPAACPSAAWSSEGSVTTETGSGSRNGFLSGFGVPLLFVPLPCPPATRLISVRRDVCLPEPALVLLSALPLADALMILGEAEPSIILCAPVGLGCQVGHSALRGPT